MCFLLGDVSSHFPNDALFLVMHDSLFLVMNAQKILCHGNENPHEQRLKERFKFNFQQGTRQDYVIKKIRTQELKTKT
jgi:hypothetical protein